jgi:uncharacterized membrane protein
MEPSTPPLQTSPDTGRREADTVRKSRFFHAIDHRPENVIIKNICEQEDIKPDREKYWLKHRKRLDDVACRRNKRSDRLKKMSTELMNEMLDSKKNSVRDYFYSIQLKHFHIDACERTLQIGWP